MPWSKDHCVITIHQPLLNVLCRVSLMQPSSLEKDSFPAIKIPPKIWDAYQIIRTTLGHFLASLAGTCSGDIFTFQVSFEVGDLLWALRVWECNIRAIQARRSTDRLRVRTLLQSEVTSWSLLFFLCFLQDTWSAVSTREKHRYSHLPEGALKSRSYIVKRVLAVSVFCHLKKKKSPR